MPPTKKLVLVDLRETLFTFHNHIQNIYMEDYIRLLSQQQSLSGGSSLITMYIPPNGRVSLSKQKLTNEMGLVSNIKSKVVQKHTKTALKSAL